LFWQPANAQCFQSFKGQGMAMHEAHVEGPFPISSLSVDRHRKTEPGTTRTVRLWAETPRKRFSQFRREIACAGRQLAKNSEWGGIQTNQRVRNSAAQTLSISAFG
jgi:hypothetical protein